MLKIVGKSVDLPVEKCDGCMIVEYDIEELSGNISKDNKHIIHFWKACPYNGKISGLMEIPVRMLQSFYAHSMYYPCMEDLSPAMKENFDACRMRLDEGKSLGRRKKKP